MFGGRQPIFPGNGNDLEEDIGNNVCILMIVVQQFDSFI